MASSPSTRLRVELQAAGENLNTWGAPKLNQGLQRLEEAICGFYSTALSGNVSLTSANYTGDQAHYAILNFTSGTGGAVTVPGVEKTYLVRNNTTGNVTVTTGSGATAGVPPGGLMQVICDGTNCYTEQSTPFFNVTSGTGQTITVPAQASFYAVRNGSSGNVIITTGSGLTAIVPAGSGTTVLCDGTNCYKLQNIDFAGATLTNVGTPSNSTDAANKAYVDAQIMASALSGTLPGQGGNAGKFLQTNGSSVSWANAGGVWTAISSNVTLVAGSSNAVDSSAARSLNLPASPGASGNAIRVADTKGLAGTNNITVTPNGSETMNGVASDTFQIDANYGDVTFVPVAGGWQTVIQ